MSRRWFGIASVLAVMVLMVAADASQAQRLRLFGRRNRTYDNTSYYDSAPSAPTERLATGPEMQGGVRQSFYAPGSRQAPAGDMPVYLDVRVPASASITIEGQKTTQTGTRRLFQSPPVASGHNYVYDLTAKWMEDGREVSRSSKVYVRPGETAVVRMGVPSDNMQQRRAPLLRRRTTT